MSSRYQIHSNPTSVQQSGFRTAIGAIGGGDLTRAAWYAQAKNGIVAGNNIAISDDDSAMTVIINGQAAGASGVTTYLGLADTSSSYGTTRQVPAVNTNSDGLEWIDVSESTRANIYSHHAIFVPGAEYGTGERRE